MLRSLLAELAYQMVHRTSKILAWYTLLYLLGKVGRRVRLKECENKVMDLVIQSVNSESLRYETSTLRKRMDAIRRSDSSWDAMVTLACSKARQTTVSETFRDLIKGMAGRQRNPEHILPIYALFVDVMSEMGGDGTVDELRYMQQYLLEFYGFVMPPSLLTYCAMPHTGEV